MAGFQAFRRAVAAPIRRSAFQYLVQKPQQYQGLVPITAAAESRLSQWGHRMASVAPEVGRESDAALISVLRTEQSHERKTYSMPKELSKGPPKPWTLTDKPGHADVILRRSYGQEDIAVTCVYQGAGYEGDEQEDMADSEDEGADHERGCNSINMSVTVSKGANYPTLEISAESYGNELTIDHVYLWEDKDSKEELYQGPDFVELDEEVRNQFERYLKARGVNRDLTGYLFSILADKEQREYMRWLQKMEAFLRQA